MEEHRGKEEEEEASPELPEIGSRGLAIGLMVIT